MSDSYNNAGNHSTGSTNQRSTNRCPPNNFAHSIPTSNSSAAHILPPRTFTNSPQYTRDSRSRPSLKPTDTRREDSCCSDICSEISQPRSPKAQPQSQWIIDSGAISSWTSQVQPGTPRASWQRKPSLGQGNRVFFAGRKGSSTERSRQEKSTPFVDSSRGIGRSRGANGPYKASDDAGQRQVKPMRELVPRSVRQAEIASKRGNNSFS